jgi:hypothetical protein
MDTVAAADVTVGLDLATARLDDLRIYDRALSTQEIKNLFRPRPCSQASDCDDGNACTADSCLPTGVCDMQATACNPQSCEQLAADTGVTVDGD